MSGPSFLGLSDAEQEWSDNDLRGYGYGEDLYRANWGARAAVALLILAAVAGLMYLQWRSGHPLTASPTTPGVTQPQSPPNGNPEAQKEKQIEGAAQSATSKSSRPDQTTQAQPGATAANGASAGETGKTASMAANQQGAKPEQSPGQANSNQATTNRLSSDAKDDEDNASQAEAPSATDETTAGREDTQPASSSNRSAGPANDDAEQQVRQAEVYLQGRGVPQNCDQGMGILRAASQRGNLRAVVKLGALYATGTCVPQDRVTAYRYFTQAHQVEPRNQALDHNRVMLWANMSDDERRRALAEQPSQ